ncbi:hypothetical protein KP509_12G073100 [Ceratopteris richardii]|uniref:U1-type domain-containing protein n=1 Tax=Ceratopteris richardii TaxID=49495 RepID=A0A8T2TPY7_CERRI|nr:hypothetical protein KP509_12G073100 [Ceratopteris richardii]
MDRRRALHLDYVRSSVADGAAYAALPSTSGRGIPPKAVPSLSTGQGFYTVESLQGATMVPPSQPAPPPPRFLFPISPYGREIPPPRLYPAEDPFERSYPPLPVGRREIMMEPPPDIPYPKRRPLLHPRPHPTAPLIGDPGYPGFHPGWREPPLRGPWSRDNVRRKSLERTRTSQIKGKRQLQKTAKPLAQVKYLSNGATSDKKFSPVNKKRSIESGPGWCVVCKIDCRTAPSLSRHIGGKRHKKQLESQRLDETRAHTEVVSKEEGDASLTASEESDKKAMDSRGDVAEMPLLPKASRPAEKTADNGHKSAENASVDTPKVEGEVGTTQSKPVVGDKRVVKNTVAQNKKNCKSSASGDALNLTTTPVINESGDDDNLVVVLDVHAEPTDYTPCLGTHASSSQMKGDGEEVPSLNETNSGMAEDGSS